MNSKLLNSALLLVLASSVPSITVAMEDNQNSEENSEIHIYKNNMDNINNDQNNGVQEEDIDDNVNVNDLDEVMKQLRHNLNNILETSSLQTGLNENLVDIQVKEQMRKKQMKRSTTKDATMEDKLYSTYGLGLPSDKNSKFMNMKMRIDYVYTLADDCGVSYEQLLEYYNEFKKEYEQLNKGWEDKTVTATGLYKQALSIESTLKAKKAEMQDLLFKFPDKGAPQPDQQNYNQIASVYLGKTKQYNQNVNNQPKGNNDAKSNIDYQQALEDVHEMFNNYVDLYKEYKQTINKFTKLQNILRSEKENKYISKNELYERLSGIVKQTEGVCKQMEAIKTDFYDAKGVYDQNLSKSKQRKDILQNDLKRLEENKDTVLSKNSSRRKTIENIICKNYPNVGSQIVVHFANPENMTTLPTDKSLLTAIRNNQLLFDKVIELQQQINKQTSDSTVLDQQIFSVKMNLEQQYQYLSIMQQIKADQYDVLEKEIKHIMEYERVVEQMKVWLNTHTQKEKRMKDLNNMKENSKRNQKDKQINNLHKQNHIMISEPLNNIPKPKIELNKKNDIVQKYDIGNSDESSLRLKQSSNNTNIKNTFGQMANFNISSTNSLSENQVESGMPQNEEQGSILIQKEPEEIKTQNITNIEPEQIKESQDSGNEQNEIKEPKDENEFVNEI